MPNVLGFTLEFQGFADGIQKAEQFANEIERAERSLQEFRDQSDRLAGLKTNLASASTELKKLADNYEKIQKASKEAFDPDMIEKSKKKFKETEREVTGLGDKIRVLNGLLRQGPVNGEEAYKELQTTLARLKAELKESTDEVRRQQRQFQAKNFATGSYKALNAELVSLRDQFRRLSEEERKGDAGGRILKNIQKLDKELKSIDKDLGIYVRNVGNYRDALGSLQGAINKLSALSVAGFGVQEIVEENAKLSDALADVRKTTNLSTASLEGYDDIVTSIETRLKGIDTRTSLADLLDITKVGGQLGVVTDLVNQFEAAKDAGDDLAAGFALERAEEELIGFSEAVDKINVALGDELEGGADEVAGALGRIVNNLSDSKKRAEIDGTGTALLAVGSAINQLASEGAGRASNITNITTRVAGIADAAGVSTPQVIGLASAIDELGLGPERASTAVQQLFTDIGKNVESFAEFTGTPLEEFTELVNTDLNEAFLLILDKVSEGGDTFTDFTAILDQIGITGAGATQTFTKLAQNTDLLRTRQASATQQFNLSSDALRTNSSIADEFAVKNQNLAAQLDKLRNQFIALVTSSGLQDFLATGVAALARFTGTLRALPQFISENRVAIGLLVVAILSFNAAQIAASVANLRRLATERLLPRIMTLTRNAQIGLNAALTANPIGIVIGLLAALAAGLIYAYNNVEDFRNFVNKAWRTVLDFYEGNLLVRFLLFQIVEPIKAAIFLFKNFQAVLSGARAAAVQFVDNVLGKFTVFQNNLKILGLEIKKAFTFDSDASAQVQEQIDGLRSANEEIRNSGKTLGEAYQEAFNEASARVAQERREKELKDAKDQKRKLELAGKEDGAGGSGGGAGGDDGIDVLTKKREDAQKKRIKAREEAAQKIQELEAQLLEDEIERAVALEALGLRKTIAGLQGDPEQINRQADLIRQQTVDKLGQTFDAARDQALQKAEERISALGEAGGLLPTPEKVQEVADQVSETLALSQNELFDKQAEAARTLAATQIASLVGSPEEIEAETARINQALQGQLQDIESQRQANNQLLESAEKTRQAKVLEIQLAALDQQLEAEKQKGQERLAARLQRINEQLAAEQLTEDEAKAARDQAEADERELELESEENYWSARLAIVEDNAAALIDTRREIAERELEVETEKNRKLIKEAEKRAKAERAINKAVLDLSSDLVGGIKDLLDEDEANRKKYGAAIKALSLAEIAINLIREIQAISASNSVYPEPAASIIKGTAIASAILKAGIAANKVRAQQFEYGGQVGAGEGVSTVSDTGSFSTPLASLAVTGSPDQGVRSLGIGHIPTEGVITGPSHRDGGVMAVDQNGRLVEFEGGEYRLQNGPETYIINKRSTRSKKAELDSLRGNPRVYDPLKRLQASIINSHKNFGVKFAEGGALASVSNSARNQTSAALQVAPIPAPVLQDLNTGPGVQVQGDILESIQRLTTSVEGSIEATNKRIDRLTVIVDPEKVVQAAADEAEIKDSGL